MTALQYLREIDIPLEERTFPKVLERMARRMGDKPYVRFEGQSLSFRQIDGLSTHKALGLRAQGIGRGHHVALLVDNRLEMLVLYFALAKLGAVALPVNTSAKGELLLYYLSKFDAHAIVVEDIHVSRFAEVASRCEKIRLLVTVGDGVDASDAAAPGLPTVAYESLDVAGGGDVAWDVHPWNPVQITFTSGTSGPSKGVVAVHGSLLSGAIAYAGGFGYTPDDVLYVCLPLFHNNAFLGSCLSALVSGATVALVRRFSASRFWQDIRETGATQFSTLGAMINILWSQPPSPEDRNHHVRICFAVPVPEFAEEFEQRFNIRFTSVYGLTDYSTAAVLRPDHPASKRRSAGQIRPEIECRIVDENDFPVPQGQRGEICMRARMPWMAAQGYYKMPEATLKAWRNQWFHCGDQGYLDEDGYLFFSGRRSEAIRRRGENVSGYEVEQIMLRHPSIQDVAVYAVTSEMSEDEVMASVVARDGCELDPVDIITFCASNMAYFMVPRFVEVVVDLPRTSTEKVEKFKLRERAEAQLSRIWDRERAGVKVAR